MSGKADSFHFLGFAETLNSRKGDLTSEDRIRMEMICRKASIKRVKTEYSLSTLLILFYYSIHTLYGRRGIDYE